MGWGLLHERPRGSGQGPEAGPRSSGEGQVPEGRRVHLRGRKGPSGGASLARGLWADPEKMLFLFLN